MLMKNDDRTLVRMAAKGDQEAFARLVERHTGMVYALAYQRVGNREDAEDIAQTVFFKAWRALPDFRGDAAFSTWLYRLTVNASTDFLRAQREHPLSLDDPDLPQPAHPGPEPFDAARETERREALVQAVHTLPEQARTVLLLREMDGLSYEEISDALEVPMGTVRSRLARARRALGSLLREQGNLWDEEPSNPEKEPSEGGTDREP